MMSEQLAVGPDCPPCIPSCAIGFSSILYQGIADRGGAYRRPCLIVVSFFWEAPGSLPVPVLPVTAGASPSGPWRHRQKLARGAASRCTWSRRSGRRRSPASRGLRLPLWTFSDAEWLPTIRAHVGDRLDVVLDNRLPGADEHTSIHWHGIRLPNDQDGIPYLVQAPVVPGDSYRYSFALPDTGTYFFHSHCHESEQLGRGLAGVLIVDGDTVQPYAADETIFLRDWLVDTRCRQLPQFRDQARRSPCRHLREYPQRQWRRRARDPASRLGRLPDPADQRRSDPGDGACRRSAPMPRSLRSTASPCRRSNSRAGCSVPPTRLDLVMRAPAEGGIATLVDQRERRSRSARTLRRLRRRARRKRRSTRAAPCRAHPRTGSCDGRKTELHLRAGGQRCHGGCGERYLGWAPARADLHLVGQILDDQRACMARPGSFA